MVFLEKKLQVCYLETNSGESTQFEIPTAPTKPYVIMVVGVNGVRKTTTILEN